MFAFKLQVNFILLFLVNGLLFLLPGRILRITLLRSLGCDVSFGAYVHTGCTITSLSGELKIGRKTSVGKGTLLDNRRGLYIGENCSISRHVKFFTLSHNIHSEKRETIGGPIIIGNNVEIFSYAMILPGIEMSSNSVLAAGSVLTRSTGPCDVYGGNPAKKISQSHPKSIVNNYPYWFAL